MNAKHRFSTAIFAAGMLAGTWTAAAQQTTGPNSNGPATSNPSPTGPSNNGGGNGQPGGGGRNNFPTPQPTNPVQVDRPVYVSGTVIIANGEPLSERVTIERVCAGNGTTSEGYTDMDGYFSFQLGRNASMFNDASTSGLFNDGTTPGFNDPEHGGAFGNADPETRFWNCELRARLPGYISTTISLAGRRAFGSPEVGTIILRPFVEVDGLTISATSALAPKDARKAFENGVKAVRDEKLDKARDEFLKAVDIYNRHAEAWLELGKLYEQAEDLDQAKEAYAFAREADPQFVYPHERLYMIAFNEGDWTAVADGSQQVIRLNPYEFPLAYYFNGVAHLQLENYDAAEESVQRALEMDPNNTNPKAHYLMGWVRTRLNKLPGAVESFRTFLELEPDAPEVESTREALELIEGILTSEGAENTSANP